jgi:hypothetical protein
VPIIIRMTDAMYEARVTPPHGLGVPWSTAKPLTRDDLVAALREQGCHQTDIADAFYAADPEWLLRSP